MDIKLIESASGHLVLLCDGFFNKSVEAAHFDKEDHFLYLTFEGVRRPSQLNCPIPEEMVGNMLRQRYIVLGFRDDNVLKATQLIPFLIHNLSEEELEGVN